MATTPTTRVTALARRYRIDIDTATFPAVAYTQLFGVEDAKLIEERRTEEDEMYDDEGAMREAVTGYNWRLEIKLAYSTNLAGSALDTVHAFLRTKFKATRIASAQASEFGIRWYDRDGLDSGDAHEGRVYVKSWSLGAGKGRDMVDIVLQGQGALADITNPAGSLTPTVTGLTPATGDDAGGNLVDIFGQHFKPGGVDDISAVVFGANAATDWTTVSDSHIVAIAPAGSAGTVAVRVTTDAGQSADTAADNYVYTS
jgi:IPT/TIG domain